MPRPAGRRARRHTDPGKLATLYAEVDPSAKQFFSKIAEALNISLAEAVEHVVQRLQPPGSDPEALPDWVKQEVAETQLPSGTGAEGSALAA
jgi:hypothetical protein